MGAPQSSKHRYRSEPSGKRDNQSIEKKIAINAGWKKRTFHGAVRFGRSPVLATWCAQMKKEDVKNLRLGEGVNALKCGGLTQGEPKGERQTAGLKATSSSGWKQAAPPDFPAVQHARKTQL